MGINLDLKQLERQIRRESLQDGLLELLTGLVFLAASAMLADALSPIIFILLVAAGGTFLRRLKNIITYPRIGYVELQEKGPQDKNARRIYWGLGSAVFLVFLALLIISGDIKYAAHWYRWMPLPFGLAMALIFSAWGHKAGLPRYYMLSVFSVLIGVIFTFLPFPGKLDGMAYACLALGMVALVTGLVLLITFVTHYPVSKQIENE